MIISPDVNGEMDGSVLRIAREINSHYPIVPITRIEGFKFNPELLSLGKYILLDYSELHWNTENKDTHLFGKNTSDYPEIYVGDEWKKFDDFIRSNPPLVYFKRELFKKDVTDNILPIDYPCWSTPYPMQSKQEFNARPINAFHYWGRSNEARVKLHADFWLNSSKNGAAICDNIFHLEAFLRDEKNTNKWVTLNIALYSRQPIETILGVNGLSKLSVSMKGSGHKCFRDAEAPVNSVMIMAANEIAYAYEWKHKENCFRMSGEPIEEIEAALKYESLYEVYCEGMGNIEKYRTPNYINNYILPLINKA